jgi:hypothetical protein
VPLKARHKKSLSDDCVQGFNPFASYKVPADFLQNLIGAPGNLFAGENMPFGETPEKRKTSTFFVESLLEDDVAEERKKSLCLDTTDESKRLSGDVVCDLSYQKS